MMNKQSPICPNTYITDEGNLVNCMCYMLEYPEHPGYLRCSCGYSEKIIKTTIYIVRGETRND